MIEAREFVKRIKPYKPGRPIEEVARELNLKGEILKLASNENPLGTSPVALKAMRTALKESFLYPDDNCFYLRSKLAERFKVAPESIIVGNGSVEILPLLTLAYVGPEHNAVMSEAAFIWYKIAVYIAEGNVIEVPMRDYHYDLQAMAKAINKDTRLVFIDNPNNPTGTMVSRKDIEEFLQKVPDQILVIIDEAYHEYIHDPEYPDSFKYFKERKNIMILRTYSKIYGLAGARLGYGIAQPNIVANLMKLRISFNVNRISQIGGIAALDDNEFVKNTVKLNDQGKEFLYAAYKKLGLSYLPTHGNFIFVNFDRDSTLVFDALQRKGIIARTVKEYGFPNALRITIGTEKQNARLIKALKEIL